ncbi:PDZ domain-containing protein 9 [Microcaecilia unicolor]|uniref:PDZ domain-containing protein 9 n=1 Tax=Microcaecilia unicolor TaxID=1415580 RepID=A0A6P7YX87_9AMPH|nr:PDZ domain-containing protein 9 [Microcaecilia unicolor]
MSGGNDDEQLRGSTREEETDAASAASTSSDLAPDVPSRCAKQNGSERTVEKNVPNRVLSSEEKTSEHTLSATLKTNLRMGSKGLGLVIIKNGPYVQITNLVEKGSAARNGRLKPGDILIKIGHANVLGYSLREIRKLLQGIPIGTELQIMVYRDLVDVPPEWQNVDLVPEIKFLTAPRDPSVITAEADETDRTSSDDDDEDDDNDDELNFDTNFRQFMAAKSFWNDSSMELPPISKAWHAFKKSIRVLTVGSDIGCDVIIHRILKTDCTIDFDRFCLRCTSPYWTMVRDDIASTSSSSFSDMFWLEDCSTALNKSSSDSSLHNMDD